MDKDWEKFDNLARMKCEAYKMEGSRNGWRMIAIMEFVLLIFSVIIICRFK